MGITADRVRLVQGDGVCTLEEELARLSDEEASGTFLHVDPYRPSEPGNGGETPLGLFARAAERGVGCMLWYGFDARDARAVVIEALHELIAGVLGCGVVVCNVGQEALAACSRLGDGLAQAYAGARLPNSYDGALEFEEGNF